MDGVPRGGALGTLDEARRALRGRVTAARAVWAEADAEDGLVASDLARLEQRLRTGSIAIGVFGLINRGKSTLVNALLGEAVSPTAATPETAVPVTVRLGPRSRGTVHLADGSAQEVDPDSIRRWTSQEHNGGNRRGVAHLDWELDADLVRQGVTLLDTPGLDDVDDTYTLRTLQHLDRVDAGLVVVSSPPTVGAREMAHLQALHERHGHRIVVACNVHEQHVDDPDVVADVVDYVRQHVTRACPDAEVVPVCATRAWRARRDGRPGEWEAAGGAAVRQAVEAVAAEMAGERIVASGEADLRRLVERAEHQVATWTEAAGADPVEDGSHRRALGVLAQVEDARLQAHLTVRHLFDQARSRLSGVHDRAGLQQRIDDFARDVDTCLHQVQGRVADRLADLVAELDLTVQHQGHTDVGLGEVDVADDVEEHASSRRVGGLAGGLGLAAAGLVLGPLGMVGGAVIGWRLGDLASSEVATTTARHRVVERLREVQDDVLRDLDERLQDRVARTRAAAQAREEAARRDAARRRAEVDHLADVVARLGALAAPDEVGTGAPPTITVPESGEVGVGT